MIDSDNFISTRISYRQAIFQVPRDKSYVALGGEN